MTLSGWWGAGLARAAQCPAEALVILVFHIMTAFLSHTAGASGIKTHLEEADIWQCLAKWSEPDL